MSVKQGLVEARGGSVHVHLGAARAFGFVLSHDLSPEHASGAEFGDFHEVVGGNAHIEFDAVSYLVHGEAGVGELRQPVGAPSQSVTEFLIDVSTAVGQQHGVNGEELEAFNVGGSFNECFGGFNHGFEVAVFAFAEYAAQGIVVDSATEGVGSAGGFHHFNQGFGEVEGFATAGVEVDFHLGQVDVFEKDVEHIHGGFVNVETERGNTLGEDIASGGIGGGWVGVEDFLTGEPVVVGASAADEGEFAGERVGSF